MSDSLTYVTSKHQTLHLSHMTPETVAMDGLDRSGAGGRGWVLETSRSLRYSKGGQHEYGCHISALAGIEEKTVSSQTVQYFPSLKSHTGSSCITFFMLLFFPSSPRAFPFYICPYVFIILFLLLHLYLVLFPLVNRLFLLL